MFNKILNHLEEWLIAFLMGAATLVIFSAVAHRYASGIPWPALQDWLLTINMSWAQELCIFMFVWMCKFGAAYGVRTGIHVGVDVVVNRLDEPLRGRVLLFGLLAGAVFTGAIGWLGAHFVWDNGAHYAFLHLLGQATGDLPGGDDSADDGRRLVHRGHLDHVAGLGGVDHLVVAQVDGHMVHR